MSIEENIKVKPQPNVVNNCPLCGIPLGDQSDNPLDGNVKHTCPDCKETFLVRKF